LLGCKKRSVGGVWYFVGVIKGGGGGGGGGGGHQGWDIGVFWGLNKF